MYFYLQHLWTQPIFELIWIVIIIVAMFHYYFTVYEVYILNTKLFHLKEITSLFETGFSFNNWLCSLYFNVKTYPSPLQPVLHFLFTLNSKPKINYVMKKLSPIKRNLERDIKCKLEKCIHLWFYMLFDGKI